MGKTTKTNNKIKCANCGKPFAPKTANARYCNPKCKAEVKNAKKRMKNAKKRMEKRMENAKGKKTANKTTAKKVAPKVASVQKVKLPKPPVATTTIATPSPQEQQHNTFLLIGMAITILLKAISKAMCNVGLVERAAKQNRRKGK